ncbi:pre-rRNA-processing protein esf1 [Elasticomyces elasticus]|nr:pre-rRNA-processing protein esf1 [Elasticomyces elasticus]
MTRDASSKAAAATDPRFASATTDPRFRLPSKKHARVRLDKRFSRMLQEDDFSKKATVDRYGRKIETKAGKRSLERLYAASDEDQEDNAGEEVEGRELAKGRKRRKLDAYLSDESAEDDEQIQKELSKVDKKYDPARGGGFTSSSDESSSDEEDSELEEEIAELPDESRQASVPLGEVSSRIAAVNLDWDNIRAVDLMVVASSFAPAPTGGRVRRVTIYPSEFGRERIEREEMEGPPREIFASSRRADGSTPSDSEDDEEEDERIKKDLLREDAGEEFDSAKLRQYQLDRLRYFYAVIECDSKNTAKALYDAMDGREYLTTANFFDLRFVPDNVEFDSDKPRDQCDRLPDGYKPNEFVTDALTHSNVRLTWDADDPTRKEVQKRAFSRAEIDDNDLQAYVGSDSSDDTEEDAESAATVGSDVKPSKAELQRRKMRAALGLPFSYARPKKEKDVPVGGMQITFASGLSSGKSKGSVFENEPIIEETTKEAYVRKEKERKARRKEKAKAARSGLPPEDANSEVSKAKQVSAEPENDAASGAPTEHDPFDDPFFTDPTASRVAEKANRKADRQKKREERAAAEVASAAERKKLELLMADDQEMNARHFDMNEIRKAEKEDKKKKKKKRGKKEGRNSQQDADTDAIAKAEEEFKVNTEDPRFARLFESHEFAIDPTNPRFRGTKGMTDLLEEGRKKRKGGVGAEREENEEAPRTSRKDKGKKERLPENRSDDEDLQKLLARVKAKTKNVKA